MVDSTTISYDIKSYEQYEFFAAYADTDRGGVVYNGRYIEHTERARAKYFYDIGINQSDLIDNGNTVFVVRRTNIDFNSPIMFEQTCKIVSRITEVKGTRIFFDQCFYVDGTLKAKCEVEMACVDTDTGRPKKIPTDLKDILCGSMPAD